MPTFIILLFLFIHTLCPKKKIKWELGWAVGQFPLSKHQTKERSRLVSLDAITL